MGGSVRKLPGGLALSFALVLAACQTSTDEMDLGTNPILYSSPGYTARMPADRVAFIPPVADERSAANVDEAAGPYPIRWMPDGYWQRPIAEMLDEVLRRELRDSGVFAEIEDAPPPSPEAVIVQIDMTDARCGLEEQAAKRRTMAELAVQVTVRGPLDASGNRDVIWKKEFREVSASEPTVRPPTVPAMFGSVTRRVVARVCAALDEANVARSGVPISTVDG